MLIWAIVYLFYYTMTQVVGFDPAILTTLSQLSACKSKRQPTVVEFLNRACTARLLRNSAPVSSKLTRELPPQEDLEPDSMCSFTASCHQLKVEYMRYSCASKEGTAVVCEVVLIKDQQQEIWLKTVSGILMAISYGGKLLPIQSISQSVRPLVKRLSAKLQGFVKVTE